MEDFIFDSIIIYHEDIEKREASSEGEVWWRTKDTIATCDEIEDYNAENIQST